MMEEKAKRGRTRILWLIIGLLVAIVIIFFQIQENTEKCTLADEVTIAAKNQGLENVSTSVSKERIGNSVSYDCNISCSNFKSFKYDQMIDIEKAIRANVEKSSQVRSISFISNGDNYEINWYTHKIYLNGKLVFGSDSNATLPTPSSNICQFKNSDGSKTCTRTATNGPLCEYHFNMLNDIYEDLIG